MWVCIVKRSSCFVAFDCVGDITMCTMFDLKGNATNGKIFSAIVMVETSQEEDSMQASHVVSKLLHKYLNIHIKFAWEDL